MQMAENAETPMDILVQTAVKLCQSQSEGNVKGVVESQLYASHGLWQRVWVGS